MQFTLRVIPMVYSILNNTVNNTKHILVEITLTEICDVNNSQSHRLILTDADRIHASFAPGTKNLRIQ